MTVTVTTEPTRILPNKAAQIICTAGSGNYVRVVCTSAPDGSAIQKQIDDEDREELQLFATESGERKPFTFDKPGSYVCTLREYSKAGVTFAGDYAEDPSGYKTETSLGSTSYTFLVGQKLTADLAIGDERGTLHLYVWDDTIRATTVPVHGEKTPRLEATTERMRTASQDATVATRLTALGDVAASAACSSLGTVADDLIDQFNAHRTQSGVHANDDTANAIAASYKNAGTPDALRETVTTITTRLKQHFTNDSGTGYGVGSASFHSSADWDNLPKVTGAETTLRAGLAMASVWHSYETHRVDTTVHSSSDTTNTATALPALLSVYERIVEVVTADNPTAPATDNEGATLLVHRAGLKKA